MITLHKLLPLLLSPLVVVIILMASALLLKKPRMAWASLVLLVLASLPITADPLWRAVEGHAQRRSADALPVVQAIVVLSGMTLTVPSGTTKGDIAHTREWGDAVDRFDAGLELFRAGRAPSLIFTGGQLPWALLPGTEGQWLREHALARGIPEAAIILTPPVENTVQEAQAVARQMPGARVILVTSAFHMRRARALFEAEGLQVEPFPVDFGISVRARTPMDWLPDARALGRSDLAVRELLGQFYYAVRHRLGDVH